MDAPHILDREFLEIRGKLLEVAASLDRIDRAKGDVTEDDRSVLLAKAIAIIADSAPDRAKQIQLLLSRPYQANWQEVFQLTTADTQKISGD